METIVVDIMSESPPEKKRKYGEIKHSLNEQEESKENIFVTPNKKLILEPEEIENSPVPIFEYNEKQIVQIHVHPDNQSHPKIAPRPTGYGISPNARAEQKPMLSYELFVQQQMQIATKPQVSLPVFSPRPFKVKTIPKQNSSVFKIGSSEKWDHSNILDPDLPPIRLNFDNLDLAIDHIVFKGGEIDFLHFTSLMCFLANATTVFENDQRNLCPLENWNIDETIVISDLHGDLNSLVKLIRLSKFLEPESTKKLVMMGDYVDRGPDGLEVVLLLACLYCKYPDRVVLLRGNHETRDITSVYGFCDELITKIPKQDHMMLIYEMCLMIFSKMKPFCVVESVLFVHGGIPYFKKEPLQLKKIQEEFNSQNKTGMDCQDSDRQVTRPIRHRFDFDEVEDPSEILQKAMNEFMWNDPCATLETGMFKKNPRGTGHLYGNEALDLFLMANRVEFLVRGHEFVAGYNFSLNNCLTLWSLMIYSGKSMNTCSIIDCGTIRVFVADEEQTIH
jgi:serine/threonine-protein phosphatase 4 catalytic subunit